MATSLEALCAALRAIQSDFDKVMNHLMESAVALQRSGQSASMLSGGAAGSAPTSMALVRAFEFASGQCEQAAMRLSGASIEIDRFISATWTGGVGGGVAAGQTPTTRPSNSALPEMLPGVPLASNAEAVSLDLVEVSNDLFKAEQRASYAESDLEWAASTFRDVVLPHVLAGGTRDELRERDRAAGNVVGLRRLEGAWEVYLGDDIPAVTVDGSGRIVSVNNGRHRILAAKRVGLPWIPMRVYRTKQ